MYQVKIKAMYNSLKAKECIKGLIGWKNHYDTTEIPELDPELNASKSGEYYNEEKHPALNLALIQSVLPANQDINTYLKELEASAITEMLGDIVIAKELSKVGKELVTNDVIYNAEGWRGNTILNEGRFVGVRFIPALELGLKATVNRIGIQMSMPQTALKLYLYHSSKYDAIATLDITTTTGGQFNWVEAPDFQMFADDKDLSGGTFYLGYYQDDLSGNAIKYDKLNWRKGYCGSCDGGVKQSRFSSVNKYMNMQPIYVPAANIEGDRSMFDQEAAIEVDETNWGLNFNISILCDLTNFWCDNKLILKNALYLKVLMKVLKKIQYSMETNFVEEQLKMMVTRDLEGDKETRYINVPMQYEKALKALKFEFSSINKVCIPCSVNSGVTYSTM